MFARLTCHDPFALVPVLSLVVVGVLFHGVVPCFPVIVIHISTLSPVVSVSPALAPTVLFAVCTEPMIMFIVRFVILRYRVSIASMGPRKNLYIVAPPFVREVPPKLIIFATANLPSGVSTVSVPSVLVIPVAPASKRHSSERKESKLLLRLDHDSK